jgi:hypothetical protein
VFTRNLPRSHRRRSRRNALSAFAVALSVLAPPPVDTVAALAPAVVPFDVDVARPHVLRAPLADVILRVRGGAVCSGTPITGTRYVITAAHCVLNRDGTVVHSRKLLRDGVAYSPVAVIVDPAYHDSPRPSRDAAILVVDQVIPGPSATLGDTFPTDGLVVLAGYQALDSDGTLLRGTRYDSPLIPKGSHGGFVKIDTAAAGCIYPAAAAEFSDDQVTLPCGLIPGASGGGLFAVRDGKYVLVGIVSTVATDLAYNGIVPLSAVHHLLDNRAQYTYALDVNRPNPVVTKVTLS